MSNPQEAHGVHGVVRQEQLLQARIPCSSLTTLLAWEHVSHVKHLSSIWLR